MYRSTVGYKQVKTEHAGAKNGGGAWMTRAEAKESARRKRRQADGMLRHMTEDEEAAGLSWEEFRPS
jgi:hypothetical protein